MKIPIEINGGVYDKYSETVIIDSFSGEASVTIKY